MTEDRLIEIEIKLTHQEDAVEELNQVVCQQQKKIDHLEAICEALIRHVKELSDGAAEQRATNETPPHY
ncbi:MAG: SlyX protein [Betaproteobacteria bacterium CG2_30_59_46]|nr:MAG: SlyX protein [Betaproteobacteria bacterium CG2_30_59_46]PIQ10596.1 MAG: SlyX protein [Hydrogenophilales bacterium CG18_big_fil_WC_8_21_14_2_50_58_12]PIY01861.1 MAG: SlyX protein [Hydrogenophilales bacterium CG_4_10_14_3_um_filter_58_23]PJB05540.1 MAG: SlyX protein [Hydrogenophilales bacterium CG_4_9_14_3_um_filter_59_35]